MSTKWTRLNNHEYLTYGRSRSALAAALLEYRAFARAHPDTEVAELVTRVAANMRKGLKERRHVARALDYELKYALEYLERGRLFENRPPDDVSEIPAV